MASRLCQKKRSLGWGCDRPKATVRCFLKGNFPHRWFFWSNVPSLVIFAKPPSAKQVASDQEIKLRLLFLKLNCLNTCEPRQRHGGVLHLCLPCLPWWKIPFLHFFFSQFIIFSFTLFQFKLTFFCLYYNRFFFDSEVWCINNLGFYLFCPFLN